MKGYRILQKSNKYFVEYSMLHIDKNLAIEAKKMLEKQEPDKEYYVIEVEFKIVE